MGRGQHANYIFGGVWILRHPFVDAMPQILQLLETFVGGFHASQGSYLLLKAFPYVRMSRKHEQHVAEESCSRVPASE